MKHLLSLRAGTGLMAFAAILFLFASHLGGCSQTDSSPAALESPTPPTLPTPEQMKFDFSFFESAGQLSKAHGQYDNFINAYLRTVILDALARLALAAPVEAFSFAINTVPVALPDGSWRWSYDWQVTSQRVGIILLGKPNGGVVEWEMRLVPEGTDQEFLWFSGTTTNNGDDGHWVFLDLDSESFPVCGEISWGTDDAGHFLEFISRETSSNGDRLVFFDHDPEFRIEFSLGGSEEISFIQWNAAGDGSLRVLDFNDGIEACWNIHHQNSTCQ